MLVVDLHTLQAVDLLHLVDDIARQLHFTHQTQDVVGVERPVGDHFALLHVLTFEHVEQTPFVDQLFVRRTAVVRGDHQAHLALGFLTEGNDTALLGEDRGLFRVTRLEQVGHAGQTTGDVTGLGGFLRNPRDHVTHADLGAVLETGQRAAGQEVRRRRVGVGQCHGVPLGVHHANHRAQVLTRGGPVLGGEHFDVGQTGELIGLVVHRNTFFHVPELNLTFHLGDDRVGVRVPGGDHLAGFGLVVLAHGDHGAVGHLVALALTTQVVHHRQLRGAGNDHQTVFVLHVLGVVEADPATVLDLNTGHRGSPARRATDVEGPHGQLGTRLTDGLGGDHADRLADVNPVTAGQITAVAAGAHAPLGLTGDRGADDHLVDTHRLELLDPDFVQHRAGGEDHLVGTRAHQVTGHGPAQHPLTQGLDDVTAFDQRRHQQAFLGATVFLGDHQILGHVHQTAGQVTGVGGFQCRVRETLTGTVGGDEVLEYVQTLTEVTGDRRLDD